jgi:uncharacterized protein DUF4124
MVNMSLLFVVPTILFAQVALAQQIFKWKNEKGQWQFSNFPLSGVATEKVGTSDTVPKSASQPSVPSSRQENKAEDIEEKREEVLGPSTYGTSDVDPVGLAIRQLLVFPPADTGKPLPEWIPVESFDSAEECQRAKALQVAGSVTGTDDAFFGRDTRVDFRALNSRCISLAEFKPSKEANVIVTLTTVGSDPSGFSTSVLSGRVFNRGQTTARSVVVKYQARDDRGTIYAEGEIPTSPRDIPPITFAQFRDRILDVGGRIVHTQANWSKN